jgi:ubiquinone/menaquinone biosynthesis C-methylase UbiE
MFYQIWRKLVRFGFRLLYHEMAWTYDAVSWTVSLGEWRKWQYAALAYVTGPCILELGHGPGHMLAALAAQGHEVYGLDLSSQMSRMAQKRIPSPLIRSWAQDLPFRSALFDTVLSTFPTEYIASPGTITSVHRVLRPGGRFVIVPAAQLTGTSSTHRFIEWLFEITGQRQGPFSLDESHKWPDREQWQPLEHHFEAAGFRTEIEQVRLERSMVTVVIAHKS